jgi:hypothetical protein
MELASCRFMAEKVCVFIIGPCGTGNYVKHSLM